MNVRQKAVRCCPVFLPGISLLIPIPPPGWIAVVGKKKWTPDRRDVEQLFQGRESLGA